MSPAVAILRFGSLAATAFAIGRLAYAFAASPTREVEPFGLRGLKRQRAIGANDLWARFEPLVRWLGVRLRGVLPDALRKSFEKQLALSGTAYGLFPEEVLALSVLSTAFTLVLGGLVGLLFPNGVIITVLLATLGPFIPWLVLVDTARSRLQSISRDMPYMIDVMQLSMSAGLDFPGAIRQIVEKVSRPDEPIIEEFGLMLQSLKLGRTRRAALEEFAERAPVGAVREFANTIVQAEQQGSSVSAALNILSGSARLRRTVEAEERASKAGIAMIAPLGLMFLATMLLVVTPLLFGLSGAFE